MNANQDRFWVLAAGIIAVLSLACNFLTQITNPSEQKSSVDEGNIQPMISATLTAQVPPSMGESFSPSGQEGVPSPAQGEGSMALIRQWASEAQASSSFDTESWAAFQAAGAPNTAECGDHPTAWASATSDSQEWINLYYPRPVYAVEINIYQTFNPDQVVSVDLIDLQGNYVNVYTAQPRKVESPCPYVLSIPTAFSGVLAQGVHITIDQSILGTGWNEIDAVEMIGAPGEGTPIRPTIP